MKNKTPSTSAAWSSNRRLSSDDVGLLLLLVALIFGAWFRFLPLINAGFPINDGGLFFAITQRIQANGYVLPTTLPYNGLHIPLAYPPLAFYVAGLINDLSGIPLIEIFRWLPVVVILGTIPAVYLLAYALLGSRLKAGLATLIFSLLPRSITWMIMGGGLTRGFGQLFLLLALYCIYQTYIQKTTRYILLSILFCTLLCLSHPEAPIHTLAIGALFWVLVGRSKTGVLHSLVIALSTLLLTSIWWLPLITRLGIDPFVSATHSSLHSFSRSLAFLRNFSGEFGISFISVLGFIGLGICIARKQWLLPLFLIIPFLVEPRNAPNVAIIPLSLLAALAISDLVIPGLAKVRTSSFGQTPAKMAFRVENGFLVFMFLYLLVGMYLHALDLGDQALSPESRATFSWISENTPDGSRFVVITGQVDLFRDYISEWFPALTARTSLTTIQGHEWLARDQFVQRATVLQEIQSCYATETPITCIDAKITALESDYGYIYLAPLYPASGSGPDPQVKRLASDLANDSRFIKVFESENEFIFLKGTR